MNLQIVGKFNIKFTQWNAYSEKLTVKCLNKLIVKNYLLNNYTTMAVVLLKS